MSTTYVRIGEIKYSQHGEDDLQAVALGSCVAMVIYDPVIKLAGMAHIALPDYRGLPKRIKVETFNLPGRYADTALPEMLNQLNKMGGLKSRLRAKIAGGANIFGTRGILLGSVLNIGERNGIRSIELLKEADIPLVGKDLGGDSARTVTFEGDSQRMIITNSEFTTKRIL